MVPTDDLVQMGNFLAQNHAVADRTQLEDLLMAGQIEALLVEVELLIHLLPWSQASEDNLDVAVWLESGEANQLAGQIDDFDRLTHVEDKDLAPLGQRSSLDDETGGLGDGHEIARDLRMGDGDFALILDLLFEQWDHAAVAAENIAKSHGGKIRLGVADREGLDHQLGDPFRRAHDIGRIDRLVGRDQDEMTRTMAGCCLGDMVGAKDVVFDGFSRAVLHQGNMLVRGRVENDTWFVFGENLVEASLVTDRANQDLEIERIAVLSLGARTAAGRHCSHRCRRRSGVQAGNGRSGGTVRSQSSRRPR